MKCPFVIKKCTKCSKLLIAHESNFRKSKNGKWGLRADCRDCEKKNRKKKELTQEEKEKRRKYREKYNKENKDKIKEYNDWYRETHKEEIKEAKKKYRENNKEKIRETQRKNYLSHRDERLIYQKEYRETHKEKISERNKKYHQENPHIKFNNSNKRRSKFELQGRGITKEQWYEMMNFFDWKCAYSGEYIGGDSEFRTIDHIVPIDSGGLNEPWNCVPCFSSYNFSKHINNMEEWYIKQEYYSEERLIEIYTWIEYAYEKWGDE